VNLSKESNNASTLKIMDGAVNSDDQDRYNKVARYSAAVADRESEE
jgi:hypothetical protein